MTFTSSALLPSRPGPLPTAASTSKFGCECLWATSPLSTPASPPPWPVSLPRAGASSGSSCCRNLSAEPCRPPALALSSSRSWLPPATTWGTGRGTEPTELALSPPVSVPAPPDLCFLPDRRCLNFFFDLENESRMPMSVLDRCWIGVDGCAIRGWLASWL